MAGRTCVILAALCVFHVSCLSIARDAGELPEAGGRSYGNDMMGAPSVKSAGNVQREIEMEGAEDMEQYEMSYYWELLPDDMLMYGSVGDSSGSDGSELWGSNDHEDSPGFESGGASGRFGSGSGEEEFGSGSGGFAMGGVDPGLLMGESWAKDSYKGPLRLGEVPGEVPREVLGEGFEWEEEVQRSAKEEEEEEGWEGAGAPVGNIWGQSIFNTGRDEDIPWGSGSGSESLWGSGSSGASSTRGSSTKESELVNLDSSGVDENEPEGNPHGLDESGSGSGQIEGDYSTQDTDVAAYDLLDLYVTEPSGETSGAAEYSSGSTEYSSGSTEDRSGPTEDRSGPAEDVVVYDLLDLYVTEPSGETSGAAEYGSGSTEYRSGPTEYRSGPPGYRSGPPGYRSGPTNDKPKPATQLDMYGAEPSGETSGAAEYGSGSTEDRSGPTEYRSGPTEYRSGPPGYRSGPPGYRSGPTEYRSGPANDKPKPATYEQLDMYGAEPAGEKSGTIDSKTEQKNKYSQGGLTGKKSGSPTVADGISKKRHDRRGALDAISKRR